MLLQRSVHPISRFRNSRFSDILRRFDEWAKAGVFEQLQVVLLGEVGAAGRIDLDRVSVDSFSLRAVKGGA